jgi:predicted outer membrane repeat protein
MFRLPISLLAIFLFLTQAAASELKAPLNSLNTDSVPAPADASNLLPLFMPAVIAGLDPWKDWHLPTLGNPSGNCTIPAEAQEENSSNPDHIIGNGTPESCTSEAVVNAVAKGGIITFNCGPKPIIITMAKTAKIFNNTGPKIVLDGKGKVALSGNDKRRILYMNTCDPNQVWTTSHCQDQDHPQLTIQNLIFMEGNSSSETAYDGGGAIWSRGGRLKIVNSRFFNNSCAATGPDVGGASVRAFSQYDNNPLYVVNSTFGGGEGFGNVCSNGGGLSSIGVSYSVYNSLFSHNRAVGYGANPKLTGTPGGGSGGAIYNDGNTFDLDICGTKIENNSAREGGGAIFFVSNDLSGQLLIRNSYLANNPSAGFETKRYPGIFYLGKGLPQVSNSVIK